MSRAKDWHKGLVGTDIGERTRALFRGLKWVLPAAFVSRLLAACATIFAARQLGPSEFGHASLALATTLWLQVPMFFGLPTALMRFVPVATPEEREEWVGTGLCLLVLFGTLTLTAAFGLRDFWARLQGVTADDFQLGVLWCFGFFFYTTVTFLAAARERFRLRASLEVFFAAVFLAEIAVLWYVQRLDAPVYVKAMAGAYLLAGLAGLLTQRAARFFRTGFARRARSFLVFGLIASGGSLAGALLQSTGRLIVNRYLDISQVGILSAYQAGSVQMALYFMGFGLHVFLPIASRTPDRAALFRKITRLCIPLIAGTALLCAAALAAYFFVLGKHYPVGYMESAVFALASGLAMQQGILTWFFSSGGSRGVLAGVIVGLMAGVLNAILGLLWIPHWGVLGAGAAIGVAYLGGVVACYIPFIKRYGCD